MARNMLTSGREPFVLDPLLGRRRQLWRRRCAAAAPPSPRPLSDPPPVLTSIPCPSAGPKQGGGKNATAGAAGGAAAAQQKPTKGTVGTAAAKGRLYDFIGLKVLADCGGTVAEQLKKLWGSTVVDRSIADLMNKSLRTVGGWVGGRVGGRGSSAAVLGGLGAACQVLVAAASLCLASICLPSLPPHPSQPHPFNPHPSPPGSLPAPRWPSPTTTRC